MIIVIDLGRTQETQQLQIRTIVPYDERASIMVVDSPPSNKQVLSPRDAKQMPSYKEANALYETTFPVSIEDWDVEDEQALLARITMLMSMLISTMTAMRMNLQRSACLGS